MPSPQDRGFASDEKVLAERRARAQTLVGQRLVRVEYVDIDYRGWDLGYHDQTSRRTITATAEWREPTWDAQTFHHLDFGIEFMTDRGETWGITWDSPNPEGMEGALSDTYGKSAEELADLLNEWRTQH